MSFVGPRRLYDLDWIAGGCVGPIPDGSNTDDTIATSFTDYLIGIIGIAAAFWLMCNRRPTIAYRILGSKFYLSTGVAYGIAGVLHHVLHEDEARTEHDGWWRASYILVLAGSLFLGLLCTRLLFESRPGMGKNLAGAVAFVVGVVHGVPIVLTAVGRGNLVLTGIVTSVALLYACAVWGLRHQWLNVLAALAMVVGMVLQVALAPTCGDAAYEACFASCPLPAPAFNHNALFHALYAAGLLALALSMNLRPGLASSLAASSLQ